MTDFQLRARTLATTHRVLRLMSAPALVFSRRHPASAIQHPPSKPMTIRKLHSLIGAKRATAARLARRLELTDRLAELHGHPSQAQAVRDSRRLRYGLQQLYTELHALEARIPTAETISEAAFRRLLALGLGIEAAENERVRVYRESKDLGFKAA